MDKWEYEVGETIELGPEQKFVVTGRKADECEGGTQRFYNIYMVVRNPLSREFGCTMQSILIPASVLNAMVKMAKEHEDNTRSAKVARNI